MKPSERMIVIRDGAYTLKDRARRSRNGDHALRS